MNFSYLIINVSMFLFFLSAGKSKSKTKAFMQSSKLSKLIGDLGSLIMASSCLCRVSTHFSAEADILTVLTSLSLSRNSVTLSLIKILRILSVKLSLCCQSVPLGLKNEAERGRPEKLTVSGQGGGKKKKTTKIKHCPKRYRVYGKALTFLKKYMFHRHKGF